MSDANRDDERSVTRARVDGLVGEIAGMMASGQWVAGESAKALAVREGVTPSAVEKWSAQAGRLLRMTQRPEEIAAKRAQNCGRLDEVFAIALEAEEPDTRGAVAAVAEQNKLLGLITEKHEVRGVSDQQVNEMMATVMRVLEKFPDAKEALLAELRLRKPMEER